MNQSDKLKHLSTILTDLANARFLIPEQEVERFIGTLGLSDYSVLQLLGRHGYIRVDTESFRGYRLPRLEPKPGHMYIVVSTQTTPSNQRWQLASFFITQHKFTNELYYVGECLIPQVETFFRSWFDGIGDDHNNDYRILDRCN